ncbi:MAG: 30S ribosomal protein S8 [Candidatus Asgardarchaeia archaeon]
MTRLNTLADALSAIMNAEMTSKSHIIVPASKLLGALLRVMQKEGYIGMFEFIDDGRSGKFKIQLLGRINKCGVISPRFPVKHKEIETWAKQYLPARDFGLLILTTPHGVMTHIEAKEKKTGGRLLAYVY